LGVGLALWGLGGFVWVARKALGKRQSAEQGGVFLQSANRIGLVHTIGTLAAGLFLALINSGLDQTWNGFLAVVFAFGIVVCLMRLAGFGGKGGLSLVTSAATGRESRFSRTAIAGACWTLFVGLIASMLLALPLVYCRSRGMLTGIALRLVSLHRDLPPCPADTLPSQLWPPQPWPVQLVDQAVEVLFILTPLVVTLLGWIAVSQIRHSAGKLHGLWLAVFDGLLFPLVVVDGLIGFLVFGGLKLVFQGGSPTIFITGILAVLVSAPVDWLIICRVWRAVNKPLDGAGASAPATPRRANRLFLAFVFGSMMLGILGTQIWLNHGKNPASPKPAEDLTAHYLAYDGESLYPKNVIGTPGKRGSRSDTTL
jgi:hypothetical protein